MVCDEKFRHVFGWISLRWIDPESQRDLSQRAIMRRAVAIAATLAGVCLLEGLSKLGRSPTELIYADGRLGDVPGFNEEAQMQWKSGEVRGKPSLAWRGKIPQHAVWPASHPRIQSLEIRVQESLCHLCACQVIDSRTDSPRKRRYSPCCPSPPPFSPSFPPTQVVCMHTCVTRHGDRARDLSMSRSRGWRHFKRLGIGSEPFPLPWRAVGGPHQPLGGTRLL